MKELYNLLNDIEENIDIEHVNNAENLLIDALSGKDIPFPLINAQIPNSKYPGLPYSQTWEAPEYMLYNELLGIYNDLSVKSYRTYSIRSNFGIGTIPSMFGLECTILNDNMPWVNHCESLDDLKRKTEHGIPDLSSGLAGKAFETYERYEEILSAYPKCSHAVKMYHPDLQGPLDNAHLMLGSDIFLYFYDDPDFIKDLLELLTKTQIEVLKKFKSRFNDETGNGKFCYHWGTLYKGKMVNRNDSAVNLSKDMYLEFVAPYDKMIYDAFGCIGMHYCGDRSPWLGEMLTNNTTDCINFGRVPGHDFNLAWVKEVQSVNPQKLPVVNFTPDIKDFEEIIANGFKTGITYALPFDSAEQAKEYIDRFRK